MEHMFESGGTDMICTTEGNTVVGDGLMLMVKDDEFTLSIFNPNGEASIGTFSSAREAWKALDAYDLAGTSHQSLAA